MYSSNLYISYLLLFTLNSGLRKRISNLFLQYVKTPMFNPEISRLLKVDDIMYRMYIVVDKLTI